MTLSGVDFALDMLVRVNEETMPIRKKLGAIPIEPLSYEELLKLRYQLTDMAVATNTLRNEVLKLKTEQKTKKPFWRR